MKGSFGVHFPENNITSGEYDTCYNAYLEQMRDPPASPYLSYSRAGLHVLRAGIY
jgi:hypothetical protein